MKRSVESTLKAPELTQNTPPVGASAPPHVESIPDAASLIAQADVFLTRSQDADTSAATARAEAARQRLTRWLTLAKRLLPVIAEHEATHRPLVRKAWEITGLRAVATNPDLVVLVARCKLALEELGLLWRSVPVQLAGALRQAADLTGNEPTLEQIEESLRVQIMNVQNVETALADNVGRLRSAFARLLAEPTVAGAVASGMAPPAPEPERTHASISI